MTAFLLYDVVFFYAVIALKMTTNISGKRSKSHGATPLMLSPAEIEIEGKQKK